MPRSDGRKAVFVPLPERGVAALPAGRLHVVVVDVLLGGRAGGAAAAAARCAQLHLLGLLGVRYRSAVGQVGVVGAVRGVQLRGHLLLLLPLGAGQREYVVAHREPAREPPGLLQRLWQQQQERQTPHDPAMAEQATVCRGHRPPARRSSEGTGGLSCPVFALLSGDPCLYIPRFAQMLEFGEKNHDVSMTAMRLVQRMKRDWMHTGRRPSGLCGAALLVSAHMHDFCRTVKEVVNVVKVCESTLRKRLTEFEDTPTSKLTVEEFMRIDLDEECDPPSYTAGLKKTKIQQLEKQLMEKMPDVEDEIKGYQDEIDAELESLRPKLKGVYAAYVNRDLSSEDIRSVLSQQDDNQSDEDEELRAVARHFDKDLDTLTVEALIKLEQKTPEEENECGMKIPERVGPSLASILGTMPSAATLGLPESLNKCTGEERENDGAADSGELDLSGIDDSEIELYLLSESEIKIKTALWMAENSDYLKEQKEKEAKIAKEKELGIYKEKKPKSSGKKRSQIRASTADEAIGKMLEQKKISTKINYDVLKDLNIRPSASPARKAESVKSESSGAKLTRRSTKPAQTPPGLSVPLSTLGKRLQPFISRQPNKKQAVESPQDSLCNPLPAPAAAPASGGVVVESGPVVYNDVADEEEDEEEDTCVSAMDLLGGNDYGFDGDDDDGF
uniref:BRF1 RNA polymerase III transcription initiation factor subunit n=1 Tax=Oryzias latipes TaxID=8090 RepID=A0A3P9MAH8_ORYLA